MTTQARKDFDDELAAWLEAIRAEQTGETLDAYADLWLANEDAAGIVDPGSPAYEAAHERVNAALGALGL